MNFQEDNVWRLAIGAALSVNPDILLLDEPTSGQDFVISKVSWICFVTIPN